MVQKRAKEIEQASKAEEQRFEKDAEQKLQKKFTDKDAQEQKQLKQKMDKDIA